MASLSDLLSWPHVLAVIVAYLLGLVLYRLTLHPLARFPGPKLTAITRYYEGYFDVIKNGGYTFQIAKLHKKYGPIVRISPYEVHINDPSFHDILYRQDARYDKYAWTVDAMAISDSTIFTVAHDLHRARRQPLSPFFSKTKVASQTSIIQGHLEKLCDRLTGFTKSGAAFNFGAAITAFARDSSTNFILGESYNTLDREDFEVALLTVTHGSGKIWHITKFIRWVMPAVKKIPVPLMMRIGSEDVKTMFRTIQRTEQDVRDQMATAIAPETDNKPVARTLIYEIMHSKLPPSEKTFDRLLAEILTVLGAGFETIAGVLKVVFFHLYNNPDLLQRLRSELASAAASAAAIDGGRTSSRSLDLKTLEQLPYLTAILTEGLRMSPGTGSRLARVAPNEDIVYDTWRIPAGTAVSMTNYLMHMEETIYPEPKRFNPDRWLDTAGPIKKTDRAFAPFSKGSRNCVGMHLAWATLYMFVTELVPRFDFQFPENVAEDFECISDQYGLGTKSLGSLTAIVTHHEA